jgi:GntR family transcriptional regulator, rspAB operon transcriptional repressor
MSARRMAAVRRRAAAPAKLGKHQPESLAQRAYRLVREEIMTGRLQPGDLIQTQDYADKLKMSRMPVYSALSALARDGLIDAIPNVGYAISPVTLADVREIFELRLLAETHATLRAMEHVTPNDIARLRELDALQNRLREKQSSDIRARGRFFHAHRTFHLTVAAMARNQRIHDVIAEALDESQRMQTLDPFSYTPQNLLPLGNQHGGIIEALASGRREDVVDAVRLHIVGAQDRLMNVLSASSEAALSTLDA